jgi:hypothetical protein
MKRSSPPLRDPGFGAPARGNAMVTTMTPRACPNCGAAGAVVYCPHCGQQRRAQAYSLRDWAGAAIDDLFLVNRRLPHTLRLLFTRPGQLTREWSNGRRARYIAPLRLYLLSAFLFFSAAALVTSDGGAVAGFLEGMGAGHAHHREFDVESWRATTARVTALLPQLMFVLLPLAAAFLHLLHAGKNRFYVEHLVFALHFQAAFFFLRTATLPLAGTGEVGAVLLLVLLVVWAGWYLARAARVVYGHSRGGAALVAGAVMIVQSVLVITGAVALAALLERAA